ncbi:MAG: hypothetical protein AVDCRST_MAG19-4369, partial [uncultured Thermomicrobiales bacterium]
ERALARRRDRCGVGNRGRRRRSRRPAGELRGGRGHSRLVLDGRVPLLQGDVRIVSRRRDSSPPTDERGAVRLPGAGNGKVAVGGARPGPM